MVEHQLPKLRVAGSNPVSRSRFFFAPVAQLDRATDFGSVSWGFDSSQARPKLSGKTIILLIWSFSSILNLDPWKKY